MSFWNPSTWFNYTTPTTDGVDSDEGFDSSGTSLGGSEGLFETENFLTESYEQVPADEGLFSKWWNGAADSFSEAAEVVSDGLGVVGEVAAGFGTEVSDRFATTWEGLQESFEVGAASVREGFDAMANEIDEAIDAGADWLGERAEVLEGEIVEARDGTVVAFEEFARQAETAVAVASSAGEAWVAEEAEQARLLVEAAAATRQAAVGAAVSIVTTGLEVQQAAIEAGEVIWDVHREDGPFADDMLDHGIERVGDSLYGSSGGRLLGSAMDFVVWTEQMKGGVDYNLEKAGRWVGGAVRDVLSGGELSGGEDDVATGSWSRDAERATSDAAQINDFLRVSPAAYQASESVRRVERGLAAGAQQVTDGIAAMEEATAQLTGEYVGWTLRGEGPGAAALLTLVGDDDFVSEREIEANRELDEANPHRSYAPDYSARAKLLQTLGDQDDPNRALFINGILNSEERASEIAKDVQKFLGGSLTPVYNPTQNFLYDGAQVGLNKLNLVDTSTALLVETIRERLRDPRRTKPLQLFPHSQGAAITSSALNQLNPEELSELEVVSFGGAAFTYPPGLRSLEVMVNVQDVVPGALGGGLPGVGSYGLYSDPDYRVTFVDFGRAGKFEDSHDVYGYLERRSFGQTYASRWQATLARALRQQD